MGNRNAHIAHDEVWTGKDLGIDALQDKTFFPVIVQRDQEGAVDIAIAVFPDINNLIGAELLCDREKVFQVLPPHKKFPQSCSTFYGKKPSWSNDQPPTSCHTLNNCDQKRVLCVMGPQHRLIKHP
jgi:hypothetical protein